MWVNGDNQFSRGDSSQSMQEMVLSLSISGCCMSRFPRTVRDARIKCIPCNAPAAETTEKNFVCVECGTTVIEMG